jgi:hypothetical protein
MARCLLPSLVAHLRTELIRYYPDTPETDIGVRLCGSGAIELYIDTGANPLRFIQANVHDSDADWFEFLSLSSGRVLTLPLMPA